MEVITTHQIIKSHHQITFLTKRIDVSPQFNLSLIQLHFIVKDKDRVAVKIRGMPYSTRYDEIAEFFKDYQYIEKSAILGVDSQGRKNGFAAILLDNHEEAKLAAKELNQ